MAPSAARPRGIVPAPGRWLWLAAVVVACAVAPATPAYAYKEFQREFWKAYAGRDADKDFRKLAKKAKCYACHQGKEDRTNYNPYGLALCDHLSEDDKKDKKKIAEALRTVEADRFDPNGDASRTFGEMLAGGELPGGPLEDCKKEPRPKPAADAPAETEAEASVEADDAADQD